jgi:hypothetical protein
MKTCPRCGRRQDSSWSECPYCKQEREAKSKSAAPEPPREEKPPMSERDARNPTKVEQPQPQPQPSARRETKYQPPRAQFEREARSLR